MDMDFMGCTVLNDPNDKNAQERRKALGGRERLALHCDRISGVTGGLAIGRNPRHTADLAVAGWRTTIKTIYYRVYICRYYSGITNKTPSRY